ncbi:MAG: GNAT family N-acetyltransferase [Bacillota bacterium]|nr:GNAT family N-acetyltransferase [Bacillota bacterium]
MLPNDVTIVLVNACEKGPARGRCPAPGWPEQAALLLQACFPGEDGYPTLERAGAEIQDLLADAACLIVAFDGVGVAGIVGGLESYHGHVWELHPLAVRADRRGQGIGSHLVSLLEEEAARARVGTIILGTDDTDERTSIGGTSIFPGVLQRLSAIRDTGGHLFAFYRRLGYEVTGVVPDANGPGKHDILMSKSLNAVICQAGIDQRSQRGEPRTC